MPSYMALGIIRLSAAPSIHTAMHQMLRAPNVIVSKKRKETLPEVAKDANEFLYMSIFRKIAHVQDKGEDSVPDQHPQRSF